GDLSLSRKPKMAPASRGNPPPLEPTPSRGVPGNASNPRAGQSRPTSQRKRSRGTRRPGRSRVTRAVRLKLIPDPPLFAQLRDWPAALGDDRLRSALQIGPPGVEVDAQVAVHRRPQVRRRYPSILDLATPGVRAAHYLATGQPAAGHQHRHAVGPVFAAA